MVMRTDNDRAARVHENQHKIQEMRNVAWGLTAETMEETIRAASNLQNLPHIIGLIGNLLSDGTVRGRGRLGNTLDL
jgi:hypothetical protein